MMEPVAWAGAGDDGVIDIAERRDIAEQWLSDGLKVEPLVRLSDAEARIAALDEEIGRLEDENSDLRCEPWPEWARAVLKVIRKHSGYDGYDDATEGVDMPLELSEHLSEMDAEAGRWKARAEAAEALLKEAGKALEPFSKVVEHDISTGEDDRDVFRPMPGQYARAERITVGHLRAARSIAAKIGGKG